MLKSSVSVLADTCFLIALVDDRDQYHEEAGRHVPHLEKCRILLPWPCLYETVSTRLVRNANATFRFDQLMRSWNPLRLDDSVYRERALDLTLELSKSGKRRISLVDMIIRFTLEDPNVRTDCLFTFNPADFSDVCRAQRIEMIPNPTV